MSLLIAGIVLAGALFAVACWLWIAANMGEAELPERDGLATNRSGNAHPDYSPRRHKLMRDW